MAAARRFPWATAALVVLVAVAVVATTVRTRAARVQQQRPPTELVETIELERVAPLQGELRLVTTAPSTLTVEVSSSDGHGFRVAPPTTPREEHSVPLLGMRPDHAYGVTVDVTAGSEAVTVTAGTVTLGSLPSGFPPVQAHPLPGGRSDGITIFDAGFAPPADGGRVGDLGYLVGVDGQGEVVWYHAEEQTLQDFTRTDAGTFLFIYSETGAREIEPTGEQLAEWSGTTALDVAPTDAFGRRLAGSEAVRVETDQFHHEIGQLPDGNLVVLSREVFTAEFPERICDDEPFDGTYDVGVDTIAVFDPRSGDVVAEHSLADVMDPADYLDRIQPGGFCGPYLQPRYPDRYADEPVRDWTHANAVVLDEARNALWVSVRHTDQLVALRYEDDENGKAGQLLYRLGRGGDFDLVGDGDWFHHQHAPEVQADGSILLYDNGNYRPGHGFEDGDQPPYSRAVEYRIDTEAMTAEQVWEHRFPPDDRVYAPYVGDADRTASGTVLIAHGGLLDPPGESPTAEGVLRHARIVEVAPDTGELLLDVRVKDATGEDSWRVYRAERIPQLYPDEYEVEPLG